MSAADELMTLAQAVNETGKWGNLIRALGKVSEVAQAVHAAEQNKAGLEQVATTLRADIDAARASLADLAAQADEVKKTAQVQAEKIVADARAQAESLVAAARAEADAIAKTVQDAKDAAAQIAGARDAAKTELNTAQSSLTDVLAKIEAAKAEARRLFGS